MGPFQFWKRMRDSSPAIFSGDTVPSDASSGYPIGSIFVQTDGGVGTCLYVNEGTATSCDFNACATGAGDVTIAASKTLAVTTADKLTVGGVIMPDTLELSILVHPHASLTVRNLWIARRACIVTAVGWVNNLVQGGALTATLVKATSTTAPVKTTTPLHTADQIDLNGVAAHTVQTLTLAASGNRTLAAGDRLGIDHGAMTTAVGVATFSIQYL